MVKGAGIPLHDAVAMMTKTPAGILGIQDKAGSLSIGKDADLVLFDDEINVFMTVVKGRRLFQKMR